MYLVSRYLLTWPVLLTINANNKSSNAFLLCVIVILIIMILDFAETKFGR